MGHGDGDGGLSSAARASDQSLPSTPAAAPPPPPAPPGGPAVTTVDSGNDDDDDSGPKTLSNTTGQSTAPVAQQAKMTGSSRVLRVPNKAEMT